MAAAAGILHHQVASVARAITGKTVTPEDSSTTGTTGSSGSSDTSDSSATISANDFLTLLVTEMQNQDPTEDTDPNEYIDQLVQVNSLEQLIDINQTLTTDLGGTTGSTTESASSQNAGVVTAQDGRNLTGAVQSALHRTGESGTPANDPAAGREGAAHGPLTQRIQGNLGVPSVNEAAQRVGHALDGRTRHAPNANITPAIH